jgi:hypothetical protein
MRFKASVLVFSILSMTASVAGAQTAKPPNDFGSKSNYIMGNGDCSILQNVEVTVEVTDDLVAGPVQCSGDARSGFSMQLNANTPKTNPSTGQPLQDGHAFWQQYVMEVNQVIRGHTQLFPLNGGGQKVGDTPTSIGPALSRAGTIPAGYKLT